MSYIFIPNRLYRMPTHFGPSQGPRQGEAGRTFACVHSHQTTTYSVSFLTERRQLDALLPPGFETAGEPVVTLEAGYITQIEWLAGRGYNILGVQWPARFTGARDVAEGPFLAVLWENLADPIMTGREELGYAKIYGELPEPRVLDGVAHIQAGWLGFTFFEMKVWDLQPLPPAEAAPAPAGAPGVLRGVLHYKYIPKTEEWGAADVAYATLTPEGNSQRVVQEAWAGAGWAQFRRARWEDLPTQSHIVNALAGLEIKEFRGATLVKSYGSKDLSDQRILR